MTARKTKNGSPTTKRAPAGNAGGAGRLPPVALDQVDLQIVELLAANGRVSNRSISTSVGLNEVTVAARIRNLYERGVLKVTAVFDWRAAGYECDFWLAVRVETADVDFVATEIAALPSVHAVHTVLGSIDILVHVLVRDDAAAVQFLTDELGVVSGIRSATSIVTLDMAKYSLNLASLPVASGKLRFPSPVVELDDMDLRLIDALGQDGRQSNRQIARELGIWDGTVRTRLQRMESSGLLRICGQTDPSLNTHLGTWACIGVEVRKSALRTVAAAIAQIPEVLVVAVTSGQHDLLLFAACADRRGLESLLATLRRQGGVRSTETWEILRVKRLDYQFARLL